MPAILEAGAQLHVRLVLTVSVGQMLHAAAAQGDTDLDYAAVICAGARSAEVPTA